MDSSISATKPFNQWYPHLFDAIIHLASDETRLSLRCLSKSARNRVDFLYPIHVVVICNDDANNASRVTIRTPHSSVPVRCEVNLSDVDRDIFLRKNVLDVDPLCAELKPAAATDPPFAVTRVLDIDHRRSQIRVSIERAFEKVMPHLHTVRHYGEPHSFSMFGPTRIVLFTEQLGSVLETYLSHRVPCGCDKFVVNLTGDTTASIPDFGMFADPALELEDSEKRDRAAPRPRKVDSRLINSWSYQMVFNMSFSGPAKDNYSFMRALSRRIVRNVIRHIPYAKHTFVIHVHNSDPDHPVRELPESALGTWNDTNELKAELKIDIAKSIRNLKPDLLRAILPSGHSWEADVAEAMVARLEVLTAEEYRNRIGDHDYALETKFEVPS